MDAPTPERDDDPFPWWKADEDTWIPAWREPVLVTAMTPEHLAGVMEFLDEFMAPTKIEALRLAMFHRYCDSPFHYGDASEQAAEEFAEHLGGCPNGAVVSLAFPAAFALVERAKALDIPIPDSLNALEPFER